MASFSNLSIDTFENKSKQPKGSFQVIIDERVNKKQREKKVDLFSPTAQKFRPQSKHRAQHKPEKHEHQRVTLKPKSSQRASLNKDIGSLKKFE
jgi:hypothetical protein